MRMIGLLLLLVGFVTSFSHPTTSWAGANYEESLKQLADGVTEGADKAKKQRLAFLDFTDSKGEPTPIGQFLAEELGTQIMVAGELTVVDRTLTYSTLKKLHVDHVDSAHAETVRRAAKAIRADVFVGGMIIETPEGLQITVRLINPSKAQTIGATRGMLPKAGPLNAFLKQEETPQPIVKIESPQEAPLPVGLGTHRNEYYEMIVGSIELQTSRAKVDLTVENLSRRDLKLLCHLQETLLKDEHGTAWHQGVEDNREGLCIRGVELSPHRKERAVLTFTGSPETAATQFTLHFREKLPRRDSSFIIDGLKVGSSSKPAQTIP
jgi:TolB-like protein